MKLSKNAALVLLSILFVATGVAVWGQGSSPTPTPPAYRGNLAGTPATQTITLNTGYQPTSTQASVLRHNLGEVLGTSTNDIASGYATDQTVTTGDNAFFNLVPGFVARSSSGIAMYLSSTSGLLVRSGTVSYVTGTGYGFMVP